VVLLEFWFGLTVRYRLSRHHWIESPSIGLVRDLLLGHPLRFDHYSFITPADFFALASIIPIRRFPYECRAEAVGQRIIADQVRSSNPIMPISERRGSGDAMSCTRIVDES
jgi:hypothetical protein